MGDRFDKSNWVYVWGVGWVVEDDKPIPKKYHPGAFAFPLGAMLIVMALVLLGVAVLEWVLPWLPWL